MNTKSLHSNRPKKIKSATDSEEHELFVLSPDLLKKLGISIGNINRYEVDPPDAQGIEISNENIGKSLASYNCSKEAPDTSILETASLMKKSVFLSPTFVSSVTNVIPGEVEISSKNNAEGLVDYKDLTEEQGTGIVPVDSIENINLVPETNSMQKACHKEDQANSSEYISVKKIDQDCSPIGLDGNKELLPDVNRNSHGNLYKVEHSYDNILHNAHSSKSNTDVKCTVNSTEINSISTFDMNTSDDKIVPTFSRDNIISEETIPLSKLKELKSLQTSNVINLSPISIKSIIGTSKPIPRTPLDSTASAVSSQTVECTSGKILNIATNVIENVDIGTNNNSEDNFRDHSIKEYDRTLKKKYASNCNVECQFNDLYKSSEDNIIVEKCNGHNIQDDHAVLAGSIDVDKCVETYKYSIDQSSKEKQPEVNNIGKHMSEPNEHECKAETRDNSICSSSFVKKNITKGNLKQNPCSKSTSKQVIHSKALVGNLCSVRKSMEDNSIVSNICLKNKEDKILPRDELANILSTSRGLSGSNSNIKADKVKEIAAYLKKFSHIYMDKKKIIKEHGNDIIKKETENSNASTNKSKLCIQGVEKPGGRSLDKPHSDKCKVVKTYSRQNPKKSKLSKNILHTYESCNLVDDSDNKLNTIINIQMPSEMQEFCLCSDFGRLTYYDNDNLYEHLHFWQHATVNCEIDLIFSIYNDEVNNYESELEQEEKTEEKGGAYTHHVCWNIFQNELTEDVDNSNQEHTSCNHQNIFKDESNKGKNNLIPETCDQAHMNHSNSDTNVETIDYAVVNSEQLLNIYQNDKINSNDIISSYHTIPISSDSENINADLNKSECTLVVFAENSDVKEQTSSNSKKNTFSKKSQHKESRRNAKEDQKEVKLDSAKTIEKDALKRRLSGKQTLKNSGDEPAFKKNIKCGLCNNLFSEMDWENHVTQRHHLIAWRAGSSINMDDPHLLKKLKKRLKAVGMLTCSICKMETRKYKKFIAHVKECIQKKLSNTNKKSDKPTRKSRTTDENVTCGVCQRILPSSGWIEHIGRNHSYLAWTNGQPALNLEDEAVVWHHLQNIVRLNGSLTCYKCGFSRSRVKLYLGHMKTCEGIAICMDETPSISSIDVSCSSNLEEQSVEQPDEVTIVKCGVCKEDVNNLIWIEHIAKEHNYMAWQEGDTPLNTDDEEAVWNHLQQFIRQNGGLTCYKCGLNRRRVKLYLTHIETCDGTSSQCDNSLSNIITDQWFEVPIESDERKVVKCAVCSQEVAIVEWIQHIAKEHNYLAWQDGCTPLHLDDESELRPYLLNVSKQIGGLVCSKCEKTIKYPKTFLQHLKECDGTRVLFDSSKLDVSTSSSHEYYKKVKVESVTCGVCAAKVETGVWLDHLQKVHNYLAWIEGQTPLNLEDAEMVQKHLYDISKMMGGLVCMKCGVRRKYVKTYQQHIETCEGNVCGGELSIALMKKDILECAICSVKVEPKNWRNHAMTKHYNIAWVVGDAPIDVNNPYAVENYLKEYLHRNNKLVCKVCGISRVSCVGFYAHIITCGKTEEETEMYKSVCDICHNKYLRIYKSQHMTMHREQEYALERKLLVAKEKEMKKEEPIEVVPGGRRKAAERAKHVIEKYKNSFHDGSHYHCAKCGFNSEIEKELADHVCVESNWGDASDSDESVKLENCSDDESDDTDIDSNISDEEREALEQASHKKRYSDTAVRMPYHVKSISAYMKKSTEEFIETYLTNEDIFTQWHTCEYKEVLENEIENYMPPIEKSCKFRFDENQDWMSFNRFESNKIKDTIVMFVGGSIQCMSWVPALTEGEQSQSQYLCLASHLSADVPRLAWDHTPAAYGLIQIWDCANLISNTPKLVLGIAHDYGTVWAIDWCPSGARDLFNFVPEGNKMHRLGLLAAACSNGSAYIFLVPYPSSITEKDKLFYKLKPVVELRLVSNENRKVYQASAIKWSTQKGHSHVVVGYADGTTAYYDLNGESPILKKTEDNMTIFYPYHDERVQNSCIEDVDVFPCEVGGAGGAGGARGGGVVCVGSAGGAGAGGAGAAEPAGLLQSHLAASRVLFPPHWPAALLAGDDCLVNQSINELEWWGGGRRLGGARVAAGCRWCGRVAAAALPLLRLMRLHPCFAEVHKQVIGTIQMAPLGTKRKRQTDELAMIVEPITYSEAVNKYGIEFKQITARDRTTQQKLSSMPRDAYAERFPLSDVTALQFCPTFKLHHKLALAMHAGFVFIINV